MKHRRYIIELTGGLALYAALLVASNLIDDAYHLTGNARIALALTPMIGAAVAAWAVMRGIWRLDEMQRRILTFGWGFAEEAGAPRQSAFMIWPLMAVGWLLGVLIARRRYR